MNKYKCPECKEINTSEGWDKATNKHYTTDGCTYYSDGNIESKYKCDYYFICPVCNKTQDGAHIDKI